MLHELVMRTWFFVGVAVVSLAGCATTGEISGGQGHPAGDDDSGTTTTSGSDDAGVTADSTSTIGATDASSHTTTSPPDSTATTAPPDTNPTTTPPPPDASSDPVTAARSLCVKTINDYRATLGLPAYSEYTREETCVDGQAAKDGAAGVAHSAFGTCSEMAQNECPGWPGPLDSLISGCFKMMWAEGPGTPFEAHGHYINMSSNSYTKVACGFHQLADGSWWATQDFYP
jgi:hypothetical protein